MRDPEILAFASLALLLTMSPGADTMLLFRNVLRGGRRAGWATAVGGRLGLVVHALLSAVGLSALLTHSAAAYLVLKLAGAAYLILLGLRSLLGSLRDPGPREALSLASKGRSPMLEGFLTNVLNPKTAVFYLAVLPQFIDPLDPVFRKSLLLCGIHVALSLGWFGLLCLLFAQARRLLTRPLVQRLMQAASGAVLTGLGLSLALTDR